MSRSGVAKWTHAQIKALCQGELEYEKVHKELMKMFGEDRVQAECQTHPCCSSMVLELMDLYLQLLVG